MKRAIMGVHHRQGALKNIGDYIQAIAANQFMRTDAYIDREELGLYSGEQCKLIMNGWFMHEPEKFPPSDKISPLVVSFHVTPKHEKQILSEAGVEFLKKNEPIGCRDVATKKLLESRGIKAYFSGCLTLTLGMSYHFKPTHCGLFLDPIIPYSAQPTKEALRDAGVVRCLVLHPLKAIKLGKKLRMSNYVLRTRKGIKGWLRSVVLGAAFLNRYSVCFEERFLIDSDYASNMIEWDSLNGKCSVDSELYAKADEMLRLYSSYKMVVTSRIHCALPCLSIGVPAIFIYDKEDRKAIAGLFDGRGRFDGIIDFLNVMSFDRSWNLSPDFICRRITCDTALPQKQSWISYADNLREKCTRFAAD